MQPRAAQDTVTCLQDRPAQLDDCRRLVLRAGVWARRQGRRDGLGAPPDAHWGDPGEKRQGLGAAHAAVLGQGAGAGASEGSRVAGGRNLPWKLAGWGHKAPRSVSRAFLPTSSSHVSLTESRPSSPPRPSPAAPQNSGPLS